jgi:hypothetical protein
VIDLAKGKYVKHSVFGNGVITESDDQRTTIDFDDSGTRKFATSMLTVEAAEGTPPERPVRKSRARKKAK